MNNIDYKDYTLIKEWPLTKEQNDLIDFGIKRPCAVLSGQAGIGKTLAVLTLVTHIMIKYKNTLSIIICPPKAIASFERELSEKLKVSYSIISTDKNVIKNNSRYLIISNTNLEKAIPTLIKLSQNYILIGIIDEAHQGLQSPTTKMYKQLLSIRKVFSVLYYTTATTCKNNIMGMYYMLYLLNPKILGNIDWFKNRYLVINKRRVTQTTRKKQKVQRTVEEIVGYKNVEELQDKLNKFIIVRQRQYNLKFNYNRIKPNDYEVSSYLKASGGHMSDNAKDFWSVRLRDITFVVDNIHKEFTPEKISNKEKLFLKVLLKNIKENKPTIVYCEYVDVLERLCDLINLYKKDLKILDILIIKGGVPLSRRKQIENEISVNKPCIITSAGGESINLQRANSIIFYDLPYDIAQIIQVIGRITRTDTKYNEQYIEILELFGTTDTYKRLCMEKNMRLIESLFGKMNTLPYTTYNNEQKFMSSLRRSLLWAFKKGRLITEEELQEVFDKYGDDFYG